jgi:transposase
MDLCGNTVRHWLNRFNARGLQGLEEDVRTGRPPTYSTEQRGAVITAALRVCEFLSVAVTAAI